ncbi:hypothetical protein INT47_007756 [Mucor saturninus]|uniref:Ndc10 domain-containing protein n=1 Tax=Mucor saturninus TaxID=64648 RepID=A0A8H7V9S1_9FUNG|nr:hypothetical protein INT47_007756 [Mucor saturninus]
MFQRFQNKDEPLLAFAKSGEWFGVKVLKTDNSPTTAWKYSSFYNEFQKAIVAVDGIKTTKVTHIGRGSGARMADLAGVRQEIIRRQGPWNNSSMNGAYLTGLPRDTNYENVGWFSFNPGTFLFAILEPPVELPQKVW